MNLLKRIIPAFVREMVYASIAGEIDRITGAHTIGELLDHAKRAVRRALGLPDLTD